MNHFRRNAQSTALLLCVAGLAVAEAQVAPPGAVAEQAKAVAQVEMTAPLSGTLFLSQQQRDRMNRARKTGSAGMGEGVGADLRRSMINGFVRRSDGTTTVWVDGQAQTRANSGLTAQIQAASVGTSVSDMHIGIAENVRKNPISTPKPAARPKPSAKKKAKAS